MNPDEIRKLFRARRELLKAAFRKMERQQDELERDREKIGDLEKQYDDIFPTSKRRPPIWKGEEGGELFIAVDSIQKANERSGNSQSVAEIIRELRNEFSATDHPLSALFKRYNDNYLEVRYCDTVKPYWQPRLKELREIEAELAALEERRNERGSVVTDDEVTALIKTPAKTKR